MKKLTFYFAIILAILVSSCSIDSPDNENNPIDKEIPYNPVPKDNSTDESLALVLSWEVTNGDSFDVYFGTVPEADIFYKTVKEPRVVVTGLRINTTYYWKVVNKAKNKSSNIWKFTTGSNSLDKGFVMLKHRFYTDEPNLVNIMFQVLDFRSKGVSNLSESDFEVLEDGLAVSPTESNLKIKKENQIDYTLKTILLIDNSTSLSKDIEVIKNAAKDFINEIKENQQVAIYKFSDHAELVQDFTNNKSTLTSAINSISTGYSTTNLYGAIIYGAKKYEESFSIDNIVQSAIVLFTDGSDTQGSKTLNDALKALENKRCYTVGLGAEIDPAVLIALGNAGFYSVNDVNQLKDHFILIQNELSNFANSFYWLYYSSPKRGTSEHTLHLSIKGNPNSSSSSYIEATFNSSNFFSIMPGIYVNSFISNPEGIDTLYLTPGKSQEVFAKSYLLENKSDFQWVSNNANIAKAIVKNDPSNHSIAEIVASASSQSGNQTIIEIRDLINNVAPKKLTVIIQ